MKVADLQISVPGWSAYLMQIERCAGLAAFEGIPLQHVPSDSINRGRWEWNDSTIHGVNFHIVMREDLEGEEETAPRCESPSAQPASLVFRMVVWGIIAAITGGWCAVLWRLLQ